MKTTFLILALLAVTATTAIAEQQLPVPQQPSVQTVPQQPEPSIPPSPQQQQPQQLIPCRDFLLQKCSPAKRTSSPSSFLWSQMLQMLPSLRLQMLQESSCQVMQERCCGQLAQIDVKSRCGAIWRVAKDVELTTVTQQQQQLGQGTAIQPQPQHVLGTMKLAQTLDEMCRLQEAPYCTKY